MPWTASFGDAGMADRTLFSARLRAEDAGNRYGPQLRSTAVSCSPLIYPIVTIFIIWAVSGHVGPAEDALGLKSEIAGWRRGLAVGLIGAATVSLWRARADDGI